MENVLVYPAFAPSGFCTPSELATSTSVNLPSRPVTPAQYLEIVKGFGDVANRPTRSPDPDDWEWDSWVAGDDSLIESELVEEESEALGQVATLDAGSGMLEHDSDQGANFVDDDFDETNSGNLSPKLRLLPRHPFGDVESSFSLDRMLVPPLRGLSDASSPRFHRSSSPALPFDGENYDAYDDGASSPSTRLSQRSSTRMVEDSAIGTGANPQQADPDQAPPFSSLLWSPTSERGDDIPSTCPALETLNTTGCDLPVSPSHSLSLAPSYSPTERSVSPASSSPRTTAFSDSLQPTSSPLAAAKRRNANSSSAPIKLAPVSKALSGAASARRLEIISSLQKMSLAILKQIVAHARILVTADSNDSGRGSMAPNSKIREPRNATITIELARRGGSVSRNVEDASQAGLAKDRFAPRRRRIIFPRNVGKGDEVRLGGRELACFMRVVELVLDGLITKVVSTKRDLYYRDVPLFRKQSVVDSILEDLAATLEVRRSDLNVVATSKGLFSGPLTLVLKDGTEKSGSTEGTLIPPDLLIDRAEYSEIEWVLVVEKDAVFQTLSIFGSDPTPSIHGKGVVITGKGYPDVSTRELVKRLADDQPRMPVMFLVDADPHGIDIMSTYVLGSAALSHDSANLAIGLDRATWIGLKASSIDTASPARDESLLLTQRDRRKALAMLRRAELPDHWRRELEYMLHLGRKAELEILSSPMSTLVPDRVHCDEPQRSRLTESSGLLAYVTSQIESVLLLGGPRDESGRLP